MEISPGGRWPGPDAHKVVTNRPKSEHTYEQFYSGTPYV